jgi:translation initiation factor IF-2
MNISTLAKILGVSITDLRDTANKNRIGGFMGRNTRIPYNSALEITKILRPDKAQNLENDDKIYLPSSLTVSELAEYIARPAGMVVKTLVMNGVMATLNEKIDYDTASLIASELGIEVFPEVVHAQESKIEQGEKLLKQEMSGDLVDRSPIVTVMGHVDHGKTTLLDTIRNSNVAKGEAGAITQHISSYQITYNNKKITFVDTPGHEAFTAMRARGSQLADFIILVVSAAEGPKPQTVEVIERAKLSKTPVIVAINKIDLPTSDVEKTKTEVAAFGLVPEEWGGNTPYIPISAKNNTNLDSLLETILLHSEVAELKGEVNCPGQALVVESHQDPQVGVITTAIVIKDMLKNGDFIRCNEFTGKIKRITSTSDKPLDVGEISDPVIILGLPVPMNSGDLIMVHESAKAAQIAADSEKLKKSLKRPINYNTDRSSDGQVNVILKADVTGSLEALKESIVKIPQEKVSIIIKHESIGQINEGDVEFANTTNSTILAFHTSVNPQVNNLLKQMKVNIIESDIIYELLQWVEEQILANTKHEIRTEILGKAEVLAVFKSEKSSQQVFGAEVKSGKILMGKNLQIVRAGEVLGTAEIVELQRNKQKTGEVNISQQFGISVTAKAKIQVGDTIECYDEFVVK